MMMPDVITGVDAAGHAAGFAIEAQVSLLDTAPTLARLLEYLDLPPERLLPFPRFSVSNGGDLYVTGALVIISATRRPGLTPPGPPSLKGRGNGLKTSEVLGKTSEVLERPPRFFLLETSEVFSLETSEVSLLETSEVSIGAWERGRPARIM